MKVLIQVTQDDIDKGAPECVSACPIALAVERAVGPCDELYVTPGAIRYRQENVVWVASTPMQAAGFIGTFDNQKDMARIGQKPMPFSFEVDFEIYRRIES